MKKLRKIFTAVLTVALVLANTVSVNAAEEYTNNPYKYTLRFYVGNQGTFKDTSWFNVPADAEVTFSEEMIQIEGLKAGDSVSYTPQAGVLLEEDSKYYVKGVRLSGRDNDDVVESFTITEDLDYVIAYGIKGEQTSYTVNYVDQEGNPLAESDTFYGNVGDKPVVAYKYIEDYVPEVLGFTKTLSDNAAENVFTFVYDEAPTPTEVEVIIPGTGTGGGTDDDAQAGDGAGTDADADDAQAGTDDDAQAGADDDAQAGDDEDSQEDEDDTIVDLDDEETPTADVDASGDGSGLGLVGSISIGVVGLLALICLILIFIKKRKEKAE